jgi:phosphatidylglycerophosphate synthase
VADKQWSELHGGVEITGFIKLWVNLSKILAKPFIFLRITPNQISIIAVLISIPFLFYPSAWWLVLIGLILDGLDGRVAIERNLTSKFGAVVDSISDRIVEFIWAIGLYMLGLNFLPIAIFFSAAWIQEYLRARAGGLGYKNIVIVTVGERPTRAIFIILSSLLTSLANPIFIIAVVVQTISLITLVFKYEREINQ